MNIYIEFGRRLAFIRQNSKLSQSQIAQKLISHNQHTQDTKKEYVKFL